MRATAIPITLVSLLLVELLSPSLAQPGQPAPAQSAPTQPGSKGGHPCAQIAAACRQAGFVAKGATTGVGLVSDCIRPIMQATPQRQQATKPLPQIDPQLVIACKNRNPNFGGGANAQPGGQSTNPSNMMEAPE